MDLYFERYDGTAAAVEDFLGCFETASARDLTDKRWYSQAGTPIVTVRGANDAASQNLSVEISQTLAPTPGRTRSCR